MRRSWVRFPQAAPSVTCENVLGFDRSLAARDAKLLAGPFAHVIVDEAQELTDAEWQMLLVRCPSRSFTMVGDRPQARHGFSESWPERLERIGLDQVTVSSLTSTTGRRRRSWPRPSP
jgi:superfamily I DNA/RNA helicase